MTLQHPPLFPPPDCGAYGSAALSSGPQTDGTCGSVIFSIIYVAFRAARTRKSLVDEQKRISLFDEAIRTRCAWISTLSWKEVEGALTPVQLLILALLAYPSLPSAVDCVLSIVEATNATMAISAPSDKHSSAPSAQCDMRPPSAPTWTVSLPAASSWASIAD